MIRRNQEDNNISEIRDILKTLGDRISKIENQLQKKTPAQSRDDDELPTSLGKSAFLNLRGKWIPELVEKLDAIQKDVTEIKEK